LFAHGIHELRMAKYPLEKCVENNKSEDEQMVEEKEGGE
jgi:hypothetical protein